MSWGRILKRKINLDRINRINRMKGYLIELITMLFHYKPGLKITLQRINKLYKCM